MRTVLQPTLLHFNSQPHKEADHYLSSSKPLQGISTHSLTRRLTRSNHQRHLPRVHFNSQPHKEADGASYTDSSGQSHFNSQPHKEADRWDSKSRRTEMKFQLTASQGG